MLKKNKLAKVNKNKPVTPVISEKKENYRTPPRKNISSQSHRILNNHYAEKQSSIDIND